jgi:tRNA pseudouridine55 synthase
VQGFLNLDKPVGFTSHDCVGKLRGLLGMRRIGHGGTLDPMATGVLPIALGSATRLLQFLPTDKAYLATIRFGVRTTTDDITGEAIPLRGDSGNVSQPVPDLQLEPVKLALRQFEGKIEQIPPNYSAIQVGGQRLYDLARRGETIEVKARPVEIFKLEVLDWRAGDFPELDLAIACGPGTYIRAIARDLGDALETGGTLTALSRTASCGFQLSESYSFADLGERLQTQSFTPIDPAMALAHLPPVQLDAEMAWRWCCGQKVPADLSSLGDESSQILRIHDQADQFLGVSEQTAGLLIPKVVMPEAQQSVKFQRPSDND